MNNRNNARAMVDIVDTEPPNAKTAAMMAITRSMTDQRNMLGK